MNSECWMFECVNVFVSVCEREKGVRMRKLIWFHDCSLDCCFFSSIQIRIVNYLRNYFYTISINIFFNYDIDSLVLFQFVQKVAV